MGYSDELFKRRAKQEQQAKKFEASVPAPVSSGPGPETETGRSAGRVEGGPAAMPPPGYGYYPGYGSGYIPIDPPPTKEVPRDSGWQGWILTAMACAIVLLLALLLRGYLPSINPLTPPLDPDAEGLTVLVVYESDPADTGASYDQRLAMSSVKVAEWLDKNCAKIDGEPAWRIVDEEADLSKDDAIFGRLIKQPRESEPWLYMTGGRREISEAMVDGGPDEFIKQLEKGK